MKQENFSKNSVNLRDVQKTDLPEFFTQQSDPAAIFMAAFTTEDPTNVRQFMSHWRKIMKDDSIHIQTILFDGKIAGHIEQFILFGLPSVGYWIGKEFWGKGVTTRALTIFLTQIKTRPLYARVAKDNLGSQRVLEKNEFLKDSEDKGYAQGRGCEVEEFVYKRT
ncbi:MAG: GNAT family N-acetyltransferase [Anaerolineaceae bacterium]|nr:GNAT family N-acetyltransferase [Anaerolineaceae bacterium]